MKLQVKKTVNKEIELDLPCYLMNPNTPIGMDEILAIFDENDCIKGTRINGFVSLVAHSSLSSIYRHAEIVTEWVPITEDEFFSTYNIMLQMASLTPTLFEKPEEVNTEAVNQ